MKRGPALRDEPHDIIRKKVSFFGRPSNHKALKGRYLFGGPVWNHFGHFFVDCIHRLWALKQNGESYDGVVFLAVQGLQNIQTPEHLANAAPPKFLADLMTLLDMPDVPVIFVRDIAVFEHLDVPEPGTAPRCEIEPFYRPYLDLYQEILTDKLAPQIRTAPEKIYMGRSHLLNKGGILGCSYFEARVREAGVHCSLPEKLSLADQLAHLIGASSILFDEGSAAHPTQVLSKVSTEFCMLPRRANNESFGKAISQRAPFFLMTNGENIETLPDRFGSTSSPGGLAIYRDPLPVYQKLKKHGFVKGPFDPDAYRAAELADLDASGSKTPEIKEARTKKLQELRS
ncbi:glycosyltransferase 61 family protein [Sulfitobacter guttiformis]|nr:glycosyltransferase 61 family protein [Sulfitobacter guttiformis]AFP55484.1 conserved hypothetical protein [Sulfitobacter guttiformis]KIN75500.1 DUF563 domain containing protein [Sulfitobacter guttiformis KCTC 32187]